MENILCKWNKESSGSYICVRQDKTFNSCNNKEHHYSMIKGSIHHEVTTIVSLYAANTGAPKYIKQILTDLKGQIDDAIVGDVNTSLSTVDKLTRQKINKETPGLNYTSDQWTYQIYTEHFIQQQKNHTLLK